VARPVDPVKLPDCQLNWEAIDKRTSALEAIEPVRKIGATGQPAFQGAWVNYDNGLTVPGGGTQRDAGFYRHLGHVYLFGVVKSGTSGTTVFTLPVGYRPAVLGRQFVTTASNGPATVWISSSGDVQLANLVASSSVATYCFLDGVVFRP
jgi:hypothetical protein